MNAEKNSEIYGSFFLSQMEFALHVSCIQEVVNLPEKLTQIPLAPEFLLGVFNLRGLIIPVVNLKSLLRFAAGVDSPGQKVAIVEHKGVRVGLLFDSTGEILRVRPEDKSAYEYQEGAPNVVGGAIKLDEGRRLIQLIDPLALVSIENIPHILENQKKFAATQAQRGVRRKCISFSSVGIQMAIEIEGIHEILRVPEIQHSPLESKICLGLIQLRGRVIPVINFAQMIGKDGWEAPDGEARRIVVICIEQEYFGLMVDSVDSIKSYYDQEVMPIPLLSKERAGIFRGCIEFSDLGQVVLLNHLQILSNAEVLEITHGHSKIYRAEDSKAAKRNADRKVYISFRLDQLFGVSIGEVKEIIDYPKGITCAPGLPKFVRGMLNLRGQLVTIVDARTLYKLPPVTSPDPKVLVFQAGEEKFGLVVDSVESILTVNSDQKLSLPKLMYAGSEQGYEQDIKEVLEVGSGGETISLTILNTAPLTERIRSGAA